MITRQKICRMPGCGAETDRQFCRHCWKKIPNELRLAFGREPDPVKRREAFRAILAWIENLPPIPALPLPVMTAEQHNAFPKGRY